MFEAILIAVLLAILLVLLAVGAGTAALSWHLTRRNRLAPDLETGAPISWLWAPTAPARQHRRLQAAVSQVHVPAPPPARRRRDHRQAPPQPGADLAATLVRHAAALDVELLRAARLPRKARRVTVRRTEADVRAVEHLAARVAHQQRWHARSPVPGFGEPTRAEALADLTHRLDLLDQANAELAEVERTTTVVDPEAILRSIAPAPAPRSPTRSPRPGAPRALPAPPPPPPGFTADGRVAAGQPTERVRRPARTAPDRPAPPRGPVP